MASHPKLKLSINTQLIDKIKPEVTQCYAEGFTPVETTIDDLEKTIKLGVAFSYQFENDYRKSEYFKASCPSSAFLAPLAA